MTNEELEYEIVRLKRTVDRLEQERFFARTEEPVEVDADLLKNPPQQRITNLTPPAVCDADSMTAAPYKSTERRTDADTHTGDIQVWQFDHGTPAYINPEVEDLVVTRHPTDSPVGASIVYGALREIQVIDNPENLRWSNANGTWRLEARWRTVEVFEHQAGGLLSGWVTVYKLYNCEGQEVP